MPSLPEPPEARKGPKTPGSQRGPYVARGLSPMSSLEDIFSDVAEKANKNNFASVLEALGGRHLRVATVCSGTEAPILALEMIAEALGEKTPFLISQLFSCEIDPLKQAFIERNFKPPILFRDLTQLGGDESTTAYGSLEKIPCGIDLLIAGTACVDFSNLNNKKEAQKETGESAATFQGLVDLVNVRRPRIVVCENVKGANWDEQTQLWNEIGYESKHLKVDAKDFYMPQTRQRGYSVSVDRKYLVSIGINHASKIVDEAINLVAKFKRRCSSPASSFLVDALDLASEKISTDIATKAGLQERRDVDWDKYRARHEKVRIEQQLGDQRPISRSTQDDLSVCKWPVNYDHRWANVQVERVVDTIDIKHLKGVIRGYDSRFKERYQDNSQGVDRGGEGPAPFGISSCVTPCGQLFASHTGKQLTGLDCLVLQGLPTSRIILAGEKERDLQGLAGNAMTTTVVAAVMLSALIAGTKLLGPHQGLPSDATISEVTEKTELQLEDGHNLNTTTTSEQTAPREDLSSTIFEEADESARHCHCEKQTRLTSEIMVCNSCGETACRSCSGNPEHQQAPKIFDKARMAPQEFVKNLKQAIPMRISIDNIPNGFFAPKTPAVANSEPFLEIAEEYHKIVDRANKTYFSFIDIKRSEVWTAHYESEMFSLQLEIENGKGEWFLYAKAPKDATRESTLRKAFEKPIAKLTLNAKGALFPDSGDAWEAIEPISDRFTLDVSFQGEKVPSYAARCGIRRTEFGKLNAWSELQVSMGAEDSKKLEYDLTGKYCLRPECGTANDSLYKKEGSENQPPIFLFLDPGKLTFPEEDAYVFSLEHRGIPGCETRRTLAELDPSWRAEDIADILYEDAEESSDGEDENGPSEDEAPKPKKAKRNPKPSAKAASKSKGPVKSRKKASSKVTSKPKKVGVNLELEVKGKPDRKERKQGDTESAVCWVRRSHKTIPLSSDTGRLCINPVTDDGVSFQVLDSSSPITLRGGDCHSSYIPLLQLSVPTELVTLPEPTDYHYTPISSDKSGAVISKLHWALQGTKHLSAFESWQPLDLSSVVLPAPDQVCEKCKPPAPSFIWKKGNLRGNRKGERLTPCENPREAANFERLIKQKPAAFEVFLRWDDSDNEDQLFVPQEGESRKLLAFGINLQSMAHVAYGNMSNMADETPAEFKWRLLEDAHDVGRQPHPPFTLPNCNGMVSMAQPPNFKKHELNEEQRRTLRWMRLQESEVTSSSLFPEQETWESFNPSTGWRVDVSVSIPRQIFGGLLADEVGFGKTATMLGLFDSEYAQNKEDVQKSSAKLTEDGLIPTNATLVIVPATLVNQWAEEKQKFLGDKYKVLKIPTIAYLKTVSIKQVQEADLIIASSSILGNSRYFEKLSLFTGCAEVPNDGKGRAAEHWFEEALAGLKETLQTGVNNGVEVWMEELLDRHNEMSRFKADSTYKPSRRLRGAKFAEHAREKAQPESMASESENESMAPESENESNDELLETIKKDFKVRDRNPDFMSLSAAFLHAFRFVRVVADEYQYLSEEAQLSMQKLSARSRWIISATPALGEFADVKTIAAHLNFNLGIDDDGDIPTKNDRFKWKRSNMTSVEQFQHFRSPHSDEWYKGRHQHAQDFLNRFARQSFSPGSSERGGIKKVETYVAMYLTAEQKSIYNCVRGILAPQKGGTNKSKNKERKDEHPFVVANAILAATKMGPPEALVRASICSRSQHRMLSLQSLEAAQENADKRWDELDFVLMQWAYHFAEAEDLENKIQEGYQKSLDDAILTVGDMDVSQELKTRCKDLNKKSKPWLRDEVLEKELKTMCDERMNRALLQVQSAKRSGQKRARDGSIKPSDGQDGQDGQEDEKAQTASYRVLRDDLHDHMAFYLSAVRRLRKYEAADRMQGKKTLGCDGCKKGTRSFRINQATLMHDCGHILCDECLEKRIEVAHTDDKNQPMYQCIVEGCNASAQKHNQIAGKDLDLMSLNNDPKLFELAFMTGEDQLGDDQAIIFSQHLDIINLIESVLLVKKISCAVARSGRPGVISDFQKGKTKVLILQLGGEMAAGLNLQNANKVFFVSPLITKNKQEYDAGMTQAIGRVMRQGQTKDVTIIHFIMVDTVEPAIIQHRSGGALILGANGNDQVYNGELAEKLPWLIASDIPFDPFVVIEDENDESHKNPANPDPEVGKD